MDLHLAEARGWLTSQLGADSVGIAVARAVYAPWLRMWCRRRGLRWRVNGEPLRVHPDVRVLVPRESEPALFRFLRETIRPGDRVLDVGSFLGTYSVFEARWAGPSGQVVAFEPTAASRAVLEHHLQMNGVSDRVTVVPAAVSDRARTAELLEHRYPYTNRIRTDADRESETSTARVDVVTLDETCARLNVVPDVIRMDVQGAEFHALQGAREIIRAGRGRLRVVVEMHPDEWPLFGVDLAAGQAILSSLGLTAEAIEPGLGCFGQGDHALLRYL